MTLVSGGATGEAYTQATEAMVINTDGTVTASEIMRRGKTR
ncbi:hypothetical protein [Haloquadratum walsbyi]|nr:hypothetical protein [Haloquadratum walsbyi]